MIVQVKFNQFSLHLYGIWVDSFRVTMNGEATDRMWPIRNGPRDAEKATVFSVAASKASHNEAVTTHNNSSSSHNGGNMVNGMQNGDMAALDSNSKLTSTHSDTDYVIQDLIDVRYAVTSKLAMYKKALPKLPCETHPSDAIISDLPVIKESTSAYMTPPSSPMLMALRDAVSSLNRMEDFEIIEEIGEGFYAKVYKVT